jgi:hypothetical protein
MRNRLFILLLVFFWLANGTVFSANVTVPSLELYTRGVNSGGTFAFESEGDMDLLVEGGYKFGGLVVLNYTSTSLETPPLTSGSGLTFKTARITQRELFGLPLSFSYFIGEGYTFCSGDIFPQYFGVNPVATAYRGLMHFPEGIRYDGIYTLKGTGLQFDLTPQGETLLLSYYLYQDSNIDSDSDPTNFEPGYYSSDLLFALNFNKLKLETFVGATYPAPDSSIGYYRGGLLFYASEESVEFMAQVGIPRWSPVKDQFDMSLFYLLFEPRVKIGFLSVIPTFFWRPGYYSQQSTNEQAFDVNLNLLLGGTAATKISGGLESNFSYQTESGGATISEFRIRLSPYLQLLTSGVIWEIRVNGKLWPYSYSDLIECFFSAKAEF